MLHRLLGRLYHRSGSELFSTQRAGMRSHVCPELTIAECVQVRPTDIEIVKDAEGRDVRLGEGGYGIVFRARMNSSLDVAVKVRACVCACVCHLRSIAAA